jgi:hypothetical protein
VRPEPFLCQQVLGAGFAGAAVAVLVGTAGFGAGVSDAGVPCPNRMEGAQSGRENASSARPVGIPPEDSRCGAKGRVQVGRQVKLLPAPHLLPESAGFHTPKCAAAHESDDRDHSKRSSSHCDDSVREKVLSAVMTVTRGRSK